MLIQKFKLAAALALSVVLTSCHISEHMQSGGSIRATADFEVPLLLISSNADGSYSSVNGKILLENSHGENFEFVVSGMGSYLNIPDNGAESYHLSFYSDDSEQQPLEYVLSAEQLRAYAHAEPADIWTVDFATRSL